MSFLAGLLSGFGTSLADKNKTLMQQEVDRRKQLAEMYEALGSRPDTTPEGRETFYQRAFGIRSLPYDKKLPKQYEPSEDLFRIAPRPGQSWPSPSNTAEIKGADIPATIMHGRSGELPSEGSGEGGVPDFSGMEEVAPPSQGESRRVSAAPIPSPPSDYKRPVFFTPQEMSRQHILAAAQQAAEVARATYEAQEPFKVADDERMYRQTMDRTQAGIRPRPVAGTISGAALLAELGGAPPPGFPPIDRKLHYRTSRWPTTNEIAGYSAADYEPRTVVVEDPNNPNRRYYETPSAVVGDPSKQATGVSGEPGVQVMGADGKVQYAQRSDAIERGLGAPKTTYNFQGIPSTGGQVGVSTSAPPQIAQGTQENLVGLAQSIDLTNEVRPLLGNVKGPVNGHVKMFEIHTLGGTGASTTEIELGIRLQRLITSQAFATGGKQLTVHELRMFTRLIPSLDDTFKQAYIKSYLAIQFLEGALKARIAVQVPTQRGVLSADPMFAPYVSLPSGTYEKYMGKGYNPLFGGQPAPAPLTPGGPKPSRTPPPPPLGMVRMRAPDGKGGWTEMYIPAGKRVQEAETRGAQRVQ